MKVGDLVRLSPAALSPGGPQGLVRSLAGAVLPIQAVFAGSDCVQVGGWTVNEKWLEVVPVRLKRPDR